MRKNKFWSYLKGDTVLWGAFLVLFILSLLAVAGSSTADAVKKGYDEVTSPFWGHVIKLIIGLVALVFAYLLPLKWYKVLAVWLIPLTLLLLIATLIFGKESNNAVRWLVLPIVGSVQTSEIAKISVILFTAFLAASAKDNFERFNSQMRIAHGVTVFFILFIVMGDLSSALLIYGIVLIMMLSIGLKGNMLLKFLGKTALAGLIFSGIAELFNLPGRFSTWVNRIDAFLNPEKFNTYNIQPDIAQIAIMEGAFSPTKPGEGIERYSLPEVHSDFIFAHITGSGTILAGLFVMLIFVAIIFRGMRAANNVENYFQAYLTHGFSIMLAIQALLHIYVVLGLGPVTGQTLPFISMGGTSILVSSFALGAIIKATATVKNEKEKIKG